MLNKQQIEDIKSIYTKNINISKGDEFYNVIPIRQIQVFFQKFHLSANTKFEHLKKYIRQYAFNDELEFIGIKNERIYGASHAYNFEIYIKYKSIQYTIKYYESIILPYGYIFVDPEKDLPNFNDQHDFVEYLKKFNNSLMFLDYDTINTSVSNISTKYHKEGDVKIFILLFRD
jgi:hypothetical protein